MVSLRGAATYLCCDVALVALQVHARDVVPAVAKLHLLGLRTGGQGQQLVTKANAKDGLGCGSQNLAQVCDCGLAHGRIARAVAEEQTIVLVNHRREVIVPRHNRELDPTLGEASDLVVFLLAPEGDR